MRGSKLVIQIVAIREFTHLEELIGAPGDTVCPFKHLLPSLRGLRKTSKSSVIALVRK